MSKQGKELEKLSRYQPRPGGGKFLTAAELAARQGELERTIWTLHRNGILPGYDLGHRIKRFTEADYIKAVQKRKTK
jgi:hypothetical protein